MESVGVERDWDRLKRWVIRKRLGGWSVAEICEHGQISRDMFYRWWNRYRAEGWDGLKDRPRGRLKSSEISGELRRSIVRLRKRYEWGPNKIEGYLEQRGFNVPHNMVYRIICEEGLNNPITEPRKTWGKKRFEREHSNSLWQSDFKLCEDDYWMISFQDDHSRFITGSEKVWNPSGENAIQLLEQSVRRFGVPGQVLTDRGTQFKPARGELSEFTEHCKEMGIQHIVASKRRPTTIGKIEAFHKAYENEAHLFNKHWTFIRYYNHKRPHEALNYLTPATVYFRDFKV
jgi:transposase InsO family protein